MDVTFPVNILPENHPSTKRSARTLNEQRVHSTDPETKRESHYRLVPENSAHDYRRNLCQNAHP